MSGPNPGTNNILRVFLRPVCFAMFAVRYPSRRERSRFEGGQAFADGIFGQLGYVVDVQLFHNVAAVCLNGFSA